MKTMVLAIAWIWIAVPLSWGVYQSVQKSIPLFSDSSQPAVTQAVGTPSVETQPTATTNRAP